MVKNKNIKKKALPSEALAKEGYKKTKLGWIPEEWKVVKLGDIAYIDRESLGNGIHPNYEFTYISLSDVETGKIVNNGLAIFKYSESPSRARRIVHKGDILLSNVRPNLLGYYIFKDNIDDTIVSTGFSVITPKDNVSSEYIYQSLYSTALQSQFNAYIVGSNYPAINSVDVKNLRFFLPKFSEQQKIAQILTTWDKAIEKTEHLIVKKQEIKKGLMQQLLTGKMRFKEFIKSYNIQENKLGCFPEDWREYKLNNLGKTYSGLSGKNKDSFGKGSPYIPYLNVFSNVVVDMNNFDYVNIDQNENQAKVSNNDIFFTTSSETPEEVGMCSTIENVYSDIYLNSFCFGYRLNNNNTVYPKYLVYFYRAPIGRKLIFRLAQGATRYNLSKKVLLNTSIHLPLLPEQQKIASILSATDNEIKNLQKQLEKLKEQKKGLMQKLLTGEVRVRI